MGEKWKKDDVCFLSEYLFFQHGFCMTENNYRELRISFSVIRDSLWDKLNMYNIIMSETSKRKQDYNTKMYTGHAFAFNNKTMLQSGSLLNPKIGQKMHGVDTFCGISQPVPPARGRDSHKSLQSRGSFESMPLGYNVPSVRYSNGVITAGHTPQWPQGSSKTVLVHCLSVLAVKWHYVLILTRFRFRHDSYLTVNDKRIVQHHGKRRLQMKEEINNQKNVERLFTKMQIENNNRNE